MELHERKSGPTAHADLVYAVYYRMQTSSSPARSPEDSNAVVSTHIISLKRSARRARVERLVELHPHVRIFDAIDKRDRELVHSLMRKYHLRPSDPIYGSPIGTAACLLSHLAVMHGFLASDKKYQLVLEDDFTCTRQLPTHNRDVDAMIRDIGVEPENVDILYLNDLIQHNSRFRVTGGHGMYAYVVSQRGARKICTILEASCGEPIDNRIQHYCRDYPQRPAGYHMQRPDIVIEGFHSRHNYVRHDDGGHSDRDCSDRDGPDRDRSDQPRVSCSRPARLSSASGRLASVGMRQVMGQDRS